MASGYSASLVKPVVPELAAETADIETASENYARRFAGSAGEWMLSVQEQIVMEWLGPLRGATVLDVGGGHGQLALPLSRSGMKVTVLGSDESCRGRIEKEVRSGSLNFVAGSVINLPFADRCFEVAASLRLLPHCRAWPQLIRELCRVARRAVVVDYPARYSVNLLAGRMFGLKRRVEENTRPFTLFTRAEIGRAFDAAGFRVTQSRAQFFWPMVLHRMLNRPGFSRALEAAPGVIGLTALLGSPVLAWAEPKGER